MTAPAALPALGGRAEQVMQLIVEFKQRSDLEFHAASEWQAAADSDEAQSATTAIDAKRDVEAIARDLGRLYEAKTLLMGQKTRDNFLPEGLSKTESRYEAASREKSSLTDNLARLESKLSAARSNAHEIDRKLKERPHQTEDEWLSSFKNLSEARGRAATSRGALNDIFERIDSKGSRDRVDRAAAMAEQKAKKAEQKAASERERLAQEAAEDAEIQSGKMGGDPAPFIEREAEKEAFKRAFMRLKIEAIWKKLPRAPEPRVTG
jgi:hypothetical protein